MSKYRIATRLNTLVAVLGMATAGSALAQSPAAAPKERAVLNFNSCAKPQYPHEELAAKHQGTVVLSFKVGTDGKVADSKVQKSSGFPALDESARGALAACSFKPAIGADDQPVMAWTQVQYVWTLD